MDFDLDDPLADILSDGSNDSFFDTIKTKKQTASAKQEVKSNENITNKKKENLFGINDSDPTTETKAQINSYVKKPSSSETAISSAAKEKVVTNIDNSLFKDDDIISDLGFDPKKPKSKMSLLDDLLAPIEGRKQSTSSLPASKSAVGSQRAVMSRQSTTETTETSVYAPSLPTTRPKTAATPRRTSLTSLNDPLKIFTKEAFVQDMKESKETPKSIRKSSPADWLGIDLTKQTTQITDQSEASIKNVSSPQIQPKVDYVQQQQQQEQPKITQPTTINETAFLLATTNRENENALQSLQQQEMEIGIASQMRNQEIALINIQNRQQELLNQQESKFNDLLQKQIKRQNQLEQLIKSQQERINSNIQMLMTQPVSQLDYEKSISTKEIIPQEETIESIQLEAEIKRLETEKLRLEGLVANINANHEKELEFVEKSHKKQISVLEENLKSIENRLQSELKFLDQFYANKLENCEKEKSSVIENFQIKIKELQQNHEDQINNLKLHHQNELESLKLDHKSMIETIRQSKLLEFSVVQENTSYLDTLRMASNNLENVTDGLQNLRDEINTKIDLEYKEKERQLINREKKMDAAEKRLKLMEDSSEKEKSRLIELVTTLEIQLNKLSKDSADEQWQIRQRMSSFEVERATFEREIQFAREQITREEKRIEDLKQQQLDENQRLREQIQNEQQILQIEKVKFETAKKLEAPRDERKTNAEIEASIKMAQEAAKQADLERERFFSKQRELDTRKRELIDQENEVRSKHDELENAIISSNARERQIRERLQKHRLAEQNFMTKSQFLQAQIRQVAERESQLSQERLVLVRERLQLQEYKRKLDLNKCSLCRIGERSVEISNILTNNAAQLDHNDFSPLQEQNHNFLMEASSIDKLFDDDVSESLKRIEQLDINLNKDFDQLDNNEIIEMS